MADARFPEQWLQDRRIRKLSSTDFRSFVVANAWSVSNHSRGAIELDELPLIPDFDSTSAERLYRAGLWLKTESERLGGARWQIVDFDTTQPRPPRRKAWE